MSQAPYHHHAASEQSRSYEMLLPGAGTRYHRFVSPATHRERQQQQQQQQRGFDGRVQGSAAGPTLTAVASAQRSTPLHVVDEPAATMPVERSANDAVRRSIGADRSRALAASARQAQPLVQIDTPPPPTRRASHSSGNDDARFRTTADAGARTHVHHRDDVNDDNGDDGAGTGGGGDDDNDDDDADAAERAGGGHGGSSMRVRFAEPPPDADGSEPGGTQQWSDGENSVAQAVRGAPVSEASTTRRRIIVGVIQFVVTTAVVFIILALFNPPFVQRTPKDGEAGAVFGQAEPTDLAKAFAYAAIGGAAAVALPYVWSLARGGRASAPSVADWFGATGADTAAHAARAHRHRRRHRRRPHRD